MFWIKCVHLLLVLKSHTLRLVRTICITTFWSNFCYVPARSSAAYTPSGSIVQPACRGDVRDGIVPQTASAIRGLVWGYWDCVPLAHEDGRVTSLFGRTRCVPTGNAMLQYISWLLIILAGSIYRRLANGGVKKSVRTSVKNGELSEAARNEVKRCKFFAV